MENIIIAVLLVILVETSYLAMVNTKRLSHKKEIRPIFVDTSVLIDGRIIAIAQSGFINGKLSIPRSVVGELQFLADHADTEKRTRARHGLDVVTELQNIPNIMVEIFQDGSKAEEGVDERLLKLAKKYNGSVCTIDYNLNKVAQVEGIQVLNVNDLAMSLRMAYLPGEKMLLELIAKGQDTHQAVGHLTDGTMVVVEHASSKIGKTVEIEFVRSLQTAAGKMMFAKLVNKDKAIIPKEKKIAISKKKQTSNKANTNSRQDDKQNHKKQNNHKNKSEQREQNFIDLLNKQ
ncbi:MAG: hypothetical protein PWQ10_244 [Patescibacteria group bacterium]|nr:hypothetical protein [Patescibacteria group bacterium]